MRFSRPGSNSLGQNTLHPKKNAALWARRFCLNDEAADQ
jgi:hypothetical protein